MFQKGFKRSCRGFMGPHLVQSARVKGSRAAMDAPLVARCGAGDGSRGLARGSGPHRGPRGKQRLRRAGVPPRVERSGRRATGSFGSLHIRTPLKFYQNSEKMSQNSSEILKILRLLNISKCSAKSREKSSKSYPNSMDLVKKNDEYGFLQKFEQKFENV